MQQNPKGKSLRLAYFALGSNVSSPGSDLATKLSQALDALENEDCELVAASSFYVTPAFPAGSGPDFLNAAAIVRTRLSPGELLKRFNAVEAQFGRVRRERWAARTLDLDLIAYEDMVLPDAETFRTWHDLPFERQKEEAPEELIVPHPRLQDRSFVLVPLCEIAPDWCHPVLGQTVQQMLDALPDAEKSAISKLS
ncbi:MAG: 2-amino-4-hydroxy-6-hydroxymethyldihydropteridine diphosphokinase [Paracoccaceae bacterium]